MRFRDHFDKAVAVSFVYAQDRLRVRKRFLSHDDFSAVCRKCDALALQRHQLRHARIFKFEICRLVETISICKILFRHVALSHAHLKGIGQRAVRHRNGDIVVDGCEIHVREGDVLRFQRLHAAARIPGDYLEARQIQRGGLLVEIISILVGRGDFDCGNAILHKLRSDRHVFGGHDEFAVLNLRAVALETAAPEHIIGFGRRRDGDFRPRLRFRYVCRNRAVLRRRNRDLILRSGRFRTRRATRIRRTARIDGGRGIGGGIGRLCASRQTAADGRKHQRRQ